jgi:hypothetical protein
MTAKLLSRIGGTIAALALIFLPLASCGEGQLTASNIFSAEGVWQHKAILFAAIAAAVLSVLIMQRWAHYLFSLVGLAAISVEYLFTQNPQTGDIQLREGAYVALFGFLLVLLSGVLFVSKDVKGRY